MPYGSYWHSCDVLPEGRRPRGHSHNCANNSHMVTREAQATTNLLPVPGKVRLSKLPKPKPARCTLFPWIQLSVPHGIYWHTSYGVLRVCYFTLRATNQFHACASHSQYWQRECGKSKKERKQTETKSAVPVVFKLTTSCFLPKCPTSVLWEVVGCGK